MNHALKNSKPIQLKGKRNSGVKEKCCSKKRPKKEYSQGTLTYELPICDEAHPSYPTASAQESVLIGVEGLQSGCLYFAGCPVPCCMTTASMALVASRTAKLGKNGIVAGCGNSSSPSTQAPKPKAAHCHAPLKLHYNTRTTYTTYLTA